jgi:magnesium transporter
MVLISLTEIENARACVIVHLSSFVQAAELEIEAYPLLDELTSKISTLNLERVRRLKSRLVALTRRVQKVNYILILSMRCISDSWF